MPTVWFHPEATRELEDAYRWYRERSSEVAVRLLREVDAALGAIVKAPLRFPNAWRGTRRCPLRRFPYSLVFRINQDRVEIMAMPHHRRRPGYWRSRV